VKTLIELGADKELVDEPKGFTPLHHAIVANQPKCVKVCLFLFNPKKPFIGL
jgi:hypothetical protein